MAESEERLVGEDDRNESYTEFLAKEHPEPEKEPEKEPENAQTDSGTVTSSSEPEKEPEKAEDTQPLEEEIEEKPQTEQKKVPLEALHEERHKVKELRNQLRNYEAQMSSLQREMQLHKERNAPSNEEEITDYDAVLKANKRKIAELERAHQERLDKIERELEAERQAREQAIMSEQILETDRELAREGYKNFSHHLVENAIAEQLKRRWAESPCRAWQYAGGGTGVRRQPVLD